MWNIYNNIINKTPMLLGMKLDSAGRKTWTKTVLSVSGFQKSVPVTYFNSPRGFQSPNPALITAESPCRRSKQSRYQTGTTYRNWLDYFSHSITAAHSARRLLIWAEQPGSPHHRVFQFTATLKWKNTTLNTHFNALAYGSQEIHCWS